MRMRHIEWVVALALAGCGLPAADAYAGSYEGRVRCYEPWAAAPPWQPHTVELRLTAGGELEVAGWPAWNAVVDAVPCARRIDPSERHDSAPGFVEASWECQSALEPDEPYTVIRGFGVVGLDGEFSFGVTETVRTEINGALAGAGERRCEFQAD